MSLLRKIYLLLAVLGAVVPLYQLAPWLQENGLDVRSLVDAWTGNAANSALFWDMTIATLALSVFVIAEVAVRRNWVALIAIPATFLIGLSCGLPLYLFLRTRPVA